MHPCSSNKSPENNITPTPRATVGVCVVFFLTLVVFAWYGFSLLFSIIGSLSNLFEKNSLITIESNFMIDRNTHTWL